MPDREKVIKEFEAFVNGNCPSDSKHVCHIELMETVLSLLKEQEEMISNYKEVVENLLQQLQDINKYMTPIGMVSDVRAYIEGRDQPEIIRCYACKHGEKASDVYLCGKSRGFGLAHEPNWFCADGERKEE